MKKTKYQILDRQIGGRLFGDGAVYDSLEEVRQQLVSYHSIDREGENDIETLSLYDILEYGEWDVVDLEGNNVTIPVVLTAHKHDVCKRCGLCVSCDEDILP